MAVSWRDKRTPAWSIKLKPILFSPLRGPGVYCFLCHVKETFAKLDVPVHAWRYAGEDDNVAGFDPGAAHAQWLSIREALWKIQQTLGPDNYDLTGAGLPADCPSP